MSFSFARVTNLHCHEPLSQNFRSDSARYINHSCNSRWFNILEYLPMWIWVTLLKVRYFQCRCLQWFDLRQVAYCDICHIALISWLLTKPRLQSLLFDSATPLQMIHTHTISSYTRWRPLNIQEKKEMNRRQ